MPKALLIDVDLKIRIMIPKKRIKMFSLYLVEVPVHYVNVVFGDRSARLIIAKLV